MSKLLKKENLKNAKARVSEVERSKYLKKQDYSNEKETMSLLSALEEAYQIDSKKRKARVSEDSVKYIEKILNLHGYHFRDLFSDPKDEVSLRAMLGANADYIINYLKEQQENYLMDILEQTNLQGATI
jgi:hypothetical protein